MSLDCSIKHLLLYPLNVSPRCLQLQVMHTKAFELNSIQDAPAYGFSSIGLNELTLLVESLYPL